MELSERRRQILSTVVEEYIRTAEPVGSKTVQLKSGLTCSSATIRNELAHLEQEGYLESPHTSSGRVPTSKGYRLYVNELMQEGQLTNEEANRIDTELLSGYGDSSRLAGDIGRLASELTSYPVLAMTAPAPAVIRRFDLIYIDPNTFIIVLLLSGNTVKNKLVHLPFSFDEGMIRRISAVFNASFTGLDSEGITPLLITSAERATGDTLGLCSVIAAFAIETLSETRMTEAVVAGKESLLKLPEFQDPTKAHRMMSYLSGTPDFGSVPMETGDIRVLIGPENIADELRDSSVVLASYDAGDGVRGLIGVVGPTRMDYKTIAAKLSYIADSLSRILNGADGPPSGFQKLMIKGDDPQ